MSVATKLDVWSALPAIGLDQLNDTAALETRVDRKYVVPAAVVEELVAELTPSLHILEIDGLRSFEYETLYFDTDHLDSYRAAARSRPRRHKIRTRTYLDSHSTHLEVKVRDERERTVKHRLPYGFGDRHHLTEAGCHFIEEIVGEQSSPLHPVLFNRFCRRTVLFTELGTRATIDAQYRCEDLGAGGRAALPAAVIVETKSAMKPGPLDRMLWRAGYRPDRMSKYCTGLAVARGGLPANKWHRTIRRHLLPTSPLVPATSSDRTALPCSMAAHPLHVRKTQPC